MGVVSIPHAWSEMCSTTLTDSLFKSLSVTWSETDYPMNGKSMTNSSRQTVPSGVPSQTVKASGCLCCCLRWPKMSSQTIHGPHS